MGLLNQFQARWDRLTAPAAVEQKLAWRAYALNSLLLTLILFSTLLFLLNIVYWVFNLDDGASAIAMVSGCSTFIAIYWVSRKKSVSVAILLFSLLSITLSFAASIGWGVTDIATTAFYVMAIFQTSLLLRGRYFVWVLGALLAGYLGFGWLEMGDWLRPMFYTHISANHLTVSIMLLFLTFLGFINSRLIDRVLTAQVAEAARRQELESRAEIAAEVQLSMLPEEPPPEHPLFDIAGQSVPAYEVRGDFYNYYRPSNNKLSIIVGDVTGKGMPAALMMAVTTGIINSLIPNVKEPNQLLAAVNAQLQEHSQRSGFLTACLVGFLGRYKLQVANAACIEPLIRRANGQLEWLQIGGLPLGVEYNPLGYRQVETGLSAGDMIIFTTDGVVESKNEFSRLLSFESLEAIVAAGPAHSAQAMRNHIFEQVWTHQGSAAQHDDVTVVVARVKGSL